MEENQKVNCATYQKKEMLIKSLTDRINAARNIDEKVKYAQDLQEEASKFLSCDKYDEKRIDCENCRLVSNLRIRTAGLIIKAKKLK